MALLALNMSVSHEDYGREISREGPSEKNFGLVFAAAFILFALAPLLHKRPLRTWCLFVSAAFLLIVFVRPQLLRGPNRIWTRIGVLLGKVVNPLVLALLFYLVFTPVALLLRLLGQDLLQRAWNRKQPSYWLERQEPPTNMSNQF